MTLSSIVIKVSDVNSVSKQDTYLWIITLKWCGFGSVLYSLFDTVSLNNLKLSKDILLGDNFLTNFAVISNTFGLIIFFVLSISLKVK